jgi:CheY-like chemotaxis protein
MALLVPTAALIVDDEPHVRAYVKLLLAKLGVETFYEAGNVPEARALWTAHRPGLVMLDVNMPGEDGLVLLREVRAADDDVYIVMLTGNVQAMTVKGALAGGADGFIRKDNPREQVLAELSAVFEQDEEG